jgi:flagellar basal-body rod protein FlgC
VANPGVASTLRPRTPAYVTAGDPGSSHADANGQVARPNVDIGTELIAARVAQSSYRASAAVIRTADSMQKTLLNTVT